MPLPETTLEHALERVAAIWHPVMAAHVIMLGQTGSGKTTLGQALLRSCKYGRVVVFDPKPHPDPAWAGPPDDLDAWGKPVTALSPMFGADREGGGPYGRWFRIQGLPDRVETARQAGAALDRLAAEGHCTVLLDDVRELTHQLRLRDRIDSLMNLGRSANLRVVMSCTETGYVAGRQQAAMTFVGKTSGLDAAKAGARLLGWRGREREDICARIAPHQWIFSEDQPGSAGPCLIRGLPFRFGLFYPPPRARRRRTSEDKLSDAGLLDSFYSCLPR